MSKITRAGGWAVVLAGALAAAGPLLAQQPGTEPRRTVRVSGIGEVTVPPDEARISLAVETFAESARGAGDANATTMNAVIQALVGAGIPRAQIETLNYSVHPEYDHSRPPMPGQESRPRILGYRATNQVVVRTPRLDEVGRLIDVALGAGANRFDGISFTVRDAEAARTEALGRAVAQARRSAEAIAAGLGMTLGDVIDASTGMDLVQPMPVFGRMEMAMSRDALPAAPPPIQPGEQTVRAQVSLVFEVVQR